jgi:hypothetical protein
LPRSTTSAPSRSEFRRWVLREGGSLQERSNTKRD